MTPFKFYIIITPNSLRFLKFALWSLHKRKDINIVLVANGLANKEDVELRTFCNQIQCDYLQLKTSKVLSHGATLNVLLAQHNDPWFCFCDSDIISIDSQANDIQINNKIKAISSCDAMFWDDSEVKGVLGRCNRWPDGSDNLASFFCIYHTETIKYLIDKYNIGFDNAIFKQIKSDKIRRILNQKGIDETSRKLDTGKVLTAALELDRHSFTHVEILSLLHIGGMSSWMLNGDKTLIHAQYNLTDTDLYEIASKDSWLFNLNSQRDTDNKIFYLRRQQRLAAARYCFQLISHYVDETPKPTQDLSDENFLSKIDTIETIIKQYYAEAL
ncbi:hypothetical protein [Marinicella gelatinilytica]|uniref:hypothetical protein n=1 Tax=Marinicella gelatinilytica TaxID=2996017 RepID=UPI002260C924|nr:hypothetical protein [Marinicella gelatinilytica]MCX7545264.1 hypothetical protein [Marinicella gelatinilytica]